MGFHFDDMFIMTLLCSRQFGDLSFKPLQLAELYSSFTQNIFKLIKQQFDVFKYTNDISAEVQQNDKH